MPSLVFRPLRVATCLAILGLCSPALAQDRGGGHGGSRGNPGGGNSGGGRPGRGGSGRHAIPELDPAAFGAVAAVIGGGAFLLARRRKR